MNLAVLAAWLHTMGKFLQRANVKIPGAPSERDIRPWTGYFVREVLPLPPELENSRSELAKLAAILPGEETGDRTCQAICSASALAAGLEADRDSRPMEYAGERLQSIFARVRLGGRGLSKTSPPLHYRLVPLNSSDAVFPRSNLEGAPPYEILWNDFVEALQKMPTNLGVNVWEATLVSLLERYCWCIPAALWHDVPDVSLYDHAAATAAITQAWLACPAGEEKFLLFGGELSGIQAFIFGREEPADRGAVRLLRGRSFLLQALTRSIWLSLLNRLQLDPAAKIMDAGGRFVLLLPDTEKTAAALATLRNDVEKWLLEKFRGALRVNFGQLALPRSSLKKEEFAASFEQFNEALERAKLQPFAHAFQMGLLPVLPINYTDYGQYGECEYCHNQPGHTLVEGHSICASCEQAGELGKLLPNTNFVVFSRAHKAGEFENLLFDGINLRLCDKMPDNPAHSLQILSIRDKPLFTISPIAGHIPVISASDLRKWQAEGRLKEHEGKLFLGDEQCEAGELKTFGMLARASRMPPQTPGEPWTCMAALGICKADVDNLGLVFSMGFGSNFSLASYTMLARMLNHFFSGYLMEVIRENFPDIYVVFAGGDDVFVIGPWTDTIEFGMRMEEDFRKFCGNNPAITISAALPLVKAGLPMRAMKEEAEEWLDCRSKEYADKSGSKNAVTIFHVSAHWEEARKLLGKGHWLGDLCMERFITRGFLRRILDYAQACQKFMEGRDLARNALYQSHFQYDLARNWHTMTRGGKGERDGGELKAEMQALPRDPTFFAKMRMGASWAIYRTRIS